MLADLNNAPALLEGPRVLVTTLHLEAVFQTLLLAMAIGVALAGCSRSQPAAPERTFDPRPVAADLVGTWEGPRGKLSFDGETLRATEYWCGKTKPTTPQFAEDSSCTAFSWELPYKFAGHHLDVTHPSGQVNRYTLFVDPTSASTSTPARASPSSHTAVASDTSARSAPFA